LGKITLKGASALSFSPKATYLSIYQKQTNTGAAKDEKNLTVWDMRHVRVGSEEGPIKVYEVFQRQFLKAEWPYFQFSDDDSTAIRCVSNEIQVIRPADGFDKHVRLRVPSVAVAKISAGPTPRVACFVPEVKGAPGSVRIYDLEQHTEVGVVENPTPLARKSFFRVTEVDLMWAPDGSAVLVLGSSEVDATNKSYYGESCLHYLKADGSFEGAVPLAKEGPVHDAQWSPCSDEFGVVYGYMPAKATIFKAVACEAKYELGAGPHNTLRWNPFGRFVALAGFGNLPGDIKFFQKMKDGKYKPIGSTRAACSVTLEWSPDGRRLLTSTVAPRLNVDNGWKVWRYNGDLLLHEEREKIYEAFWRPVPDGTFEDRPISPASKRVDNGDGVTATGAPAAKAGAYRPPHAAQTAYRPPHATSGGGNFSLAKASADEMKAGKVKPATAKSTITASQGPPGSGGGELTGAALKNAKKRAAKKRAADAAKQLEAL
jgi:translation initiation factor 2A